MIDEEKFNNIYDKLKFAYGEESEIRMCIEEMSELTKELCKFIRYLATPDIDEKQKQNLLKEVRQNIIEETADVLICASQIKRIFGEEAVEKMMNYKVERVEGYVDSYIEKHNLNKSEDK